MSRDASNSGSNTVSTSNSTTTALSSGATFTGIAEDCKAYDSIILTCKTDQSGTMYIDFSPDGTNWDRTLSYDVIAGTPEAHRVTVVYAYFRVRFTNTSISAQSYLRLQVLLGSHQSLTARMDSTVTSDQDTLITRSVLAGETDGGVYVNVPVTPEGHLEVALHAPRLPFGSIHTENMTPVFQTDAVYGINSGQVTTGSTLSGSATASDASFVISTGTTIYAQAFIQSRKRLRYRPGQGVIGRFAASFTSGVANSYQVVGFGHAEDGVYFGYKDTDFGILYVNRGVRETRTLTITTASSTTENVTVTLNGTAHTVAVTNSANIQRTVWEISTATYSGWKAYPSGATIVFVRDAAGTASGSYSITATTAVGTFAQTKAGVASTDTFIPQSTWNGDTVDGTGSSGMTLDPTKGNVYEIGIQYLGSGAITFKIEHSPTGTNNTEFIVVHTLKFPNTLTATSFRNPSFPLSGAVYSAGSTTNLTVKMGSFAGFIEGEKKLHGNRFTYVNTLTTVGATNYQALFTILNTRYYAGTANQAVVNMLSVTGALKHTSPCIFYLIKNGSLVGNPNFTTLSTNSCTLYDTTATTVTYSTGDQLLWTGHLGDTGELDHHFNGGGAEELTIQPGEWFTLAAKAATGTPSYVTGAINTREDQ